MAGRNNKTGLDYFELDCHMDSSIRLIQAEFGLKGFAVFVKLLQEIYGEYGYYCEWTQDKELLFASENGLSSGSSGLLGEILSACIRRDIFSEKLFKKYGILTSSGVQKQYLKATVKREVVSMKKEYLLISIPENRKNVVVNSISVGINSISDGRNAQSRVEKSREENIYTVHSEEMHDACLLEDFFESIWKLYPVKKGKGQVSKTKKKVLQKIGLEELKRCIERYKDDMSKGDRNYWMNGSTFFNSGYVDYLDENFLSGNEEQQIISEPEENNEELVGDDW
jgi:hypothetical protein